MLPLAGFERRFEVAQALADCVAVVRIADQPGGGQHLGMRDRAADVVGHEARIEQVVLSRRVSQHALGERQAFFPQPGHS